MTKGATLLRQTEGEYDWTPESEIHVGPQPSYHIPDPDKRTCDDWIQLGKEDELNGRNLSALETYKETLARFPDSFAAGKAAGRLAASLLRFAGGQETFSSRFMRGILLTRKSPTISALLMMAWARRDHARAAFEQAERLPSFYSAAALAPRRVAGAGRRLARCRAPSGRSSASCARTIFALWRS